MKPWWFLAREVDDSLFW